ncbi:amidohydrolase family protein [Paenibacillus filicis]|uniref:Amidohydrolase family protein n=1 Tax=Paenibacillus gyeongsangnamensis TaxID=3388067 RepID=A0ABT4QL18_9BACL|nr:amidohydrolase family protein [Paenibacillus filicis]MCZ8517568.1 amidohydrolase family protein [Paenibacillus filicis]
MQSGSLIIDTDIHNAIRRREDMLPFLPKVWHQQWMDNEVGVYGQYYSPLGVMRKDAVPDSGGSPGSDPLYVLKHHMDPYGIDFGILTGSGVLGISLHADPDYANAIASAYNDWQIEHWLKVSPKFKGSILINHSDPAAAAQEIDRMGPHPDMVQVIMSSGARMPYGQRFYHPIYEAAERNGLPVAVHPGTEGKGISGAPTPSGYPTRYMEWHNILPANYMTHINSLVCEGVFEKFPKLKFVAIEGGIAWLPHLMWRMDKNYKALRDTTPWLKRLPSEYILEHVRLTTQPIEEPADIDHLVQIFNMIRADEIVMFSSDYPHWDFDNPKIALNGIPREMKQRILGQNAADLYKLHKQPVESKGVEAQ